MRRVAAKNDPISAAHARAQLTALLNSATDERLAGFEVGTLARMHRVPEREIECALLAARARRARENAAND